RHQRIRRGGVEADRVRIDDLDARDLLRVRGEWRRAGRHLGNAVDRRDDVGGGEITAVVELDALAQRELPRQRRDRRPLRRERRLELLLLIALHQIAVDVLRDVVVRRQVVIVRVERGDVRRKADRQVRGIRGQAAHRQQRGEQQVREAHRKLLPRKKRTL